MVRLMRRDRASRSAMVAAPLLALGAAVLVSLILFAALGKPAGVALHALLIRPFASWYSFSEVLLKAAPLMLIAQGLAIGFRANVFNIGAEGQFVMGAVAASALPVLGGDPSGPWVMPLMLGAGMAGGLAWAGLAAFARDRFGASEILVTLMQSLIAVQVLNYLLLGPWKDPRGFNFPVSVMFPDAALLPILLPGTRTNVLLVFALLASVLAWVLMRHRLTGFQLLVGGLAPGAARYAGIAPRRAVWLSLGLGGLAAGLAGAGEVMGPLGQLQRSVAAGYGYAAIVVAYVGGLNPLGIVVAAVAISAVYIGGDAATVSAGLPVPAVEVFQGLLLAFYLVAFVLVRYRIARMPGPATRAATPRRGGRPRTFDGPVPSAADGGP
ncbi:ABC transporter permease [Jannaschia sp. LMIT008]|uniref:ABC transporter permease n=1 Tax=Jannaschia maritima TaxID=3032585 RepID=UPI002810F806|nr:ABC transporter permease [Jannaschia sp. LMIT008]